jgi:hypothetical protein
MVNNAKIVVEKLPLDKGLATKLTGVLKATPH